MVSDAQAEECLFRSSAGALRFALNFTHGSLALPPLSQLMGGGHSARGLGGLDGAGMAGMIGAELSRLSVFKQALLIARFTESTTPCKCGEPCCCGFRPNKNWIAAVYVLAEYVHEEGLGGTISHQRLRMELVKRHFGVRHSLIQIADICGINRDTAGAYFNRVTERFKRQEKIAFGEIDGYLKAAGIVG